MPSQLFGSNRYSSKVAVFPEPDGTSSGAVRYNW
jgi:hypothetical protein